MVAVWKILTLFFYLSFCWQYSQNNRLQIHSTRLGNQFRCTKYLWEECLKLKKLKVWWIENFLAEMIVTLIQIFLPKNTIRVFWGDLSCWSNFSGIFEKNHFFIAIIFDKICIEIVSLQIISPRKFFQLCPLGWYF